jgi:hypothetical protein
VEPMKSMRTVLAAIAVVAITAAALQAGTTDYWGRKLPNGPTQFMFGYGSLINSQSRNSTATNPIPAIPVRVAAGFGYVRAWVDRSASGFTALGLRKPGPDENASTINGILYPVEGDDMMNFDQREAGYARVAVPKDMIEAVSWQGLPEHAQMWVYVPIGPNGKVGEGLSVATADYPLLQLCNFQRRTVRRCQCTTHLRWRRDHGDAVRTAWEPLRVA